MLNMRRGRRGFSQPGLRLSMRGLYHVSDNTLNLAFNSGTQSAVFIIETVKGSSTNRWLRSFMVVLHLHGREWGGNVAFQLKNWEFSLCVFLQNYPHCISPNHGNCQNNLYPLEKKLSMSQLTAPF